MINGYDIEAMDMNAFFKLKKYTDEAHFKPEHIKRVSNAASIVAEWVCAIVNFLQVRYDSTP